MPIWATLGHDVSIEMNDENESSLKLKKGSRVNVEKLEHLSVYLADYGWIGVQSKINFFMVG